MLLGGRLKHARKTLKLTQSDVESRTKIGISTLSDFEKDKREPKLSQLKLLADLYQRSTSFFLEEGSITAEPTVLWRERPECAEQIEIRFLQLCRQYHNLEVWCNDRAAVSIPEVKYNPSSFSYENAEELAKHVRRELQLGDRPGQCLLAVLEEACGIKVFHLDFEPSGTAASVVSDSFGVAVLLNAKNIRWRRNYDLAHELFHLLTWSLFHSEPCSLKSTSKREEQLANAFAANLLLPTESIRSAVNSRMNKGRITYESLFDIAREFDASMDSLIWRMHHVYNRGSSESDQTKREIEQAKRLAPIFEDRESSRPHPWPSRYRALAIKALRRGEISIGRFAEYLNISRHEAMRFVEQEAPSDEEIQVTSI